MAIAEANAGIIKMKMLASFINEDARKVRQEAEVLASDFEREFMCAPHQDISDDMDGRYIRKGPMYYLNDFHSEEGFKQIAATGAVPVNDEMKIKLVTIEKLYPRISEVYQKNKYVDEVWYLDKQSIAGGNTHMNVLSRVPPGFDIGGEYDRGERPYSRFGIIGPEQNPSKKSLWSPNALIEIFDEFVISAQAPVYIRGEFSGKISIHYNLIHLRKDTLLKSCLNFLLITDQFTVVGMSPGVREIAEFVEYEKKTWSSKKAKMEFIDNELNLAKRDPDFTDQLKSIKKGGSVDCKFKGKSYQLFKEPIPEIGFQLLLVLPY
jgi:hypothetical protein